MVMGNLSYVSFLYVSVLGMPGQRERGDFNSFTKKPGSPEEFWGIPRVGVEGLIGEEESKPLPLGQGFSPHPFRVNTQANKRQH